MIFLIMKLASRSAAGRRKQEKLVFKALFVTAIWDFVRGVAGRKFSGFPNDSNYIGAIVIMESWMLTVSESWRGASRGCREVSSYMLRGELELHLGKMIQRNKYTHSIKPRSLAGKQCGRASW